MYDVVVPLLAASQRILLICHVAPDGDAIGDANQHSDGDWNCDVDTDLHSDSYCDSYGHPDIC